MISKSVKRDVFDFEIGYLTRSPCISCKNRKNLPGCSIDCQILDKIRTVLSRGISSQAGGYES